MYMGMIGTLPRYNTMTFQGSFLPPTIYELRYLEMLGTYPIAGIHETVRYITMMLQAAGFRRF